LPSPAPEQQLHGKDMENAITRLQDSLASVQLVLEEYEQAGLGYVI